MDFGYITYPVQSRKSSLGFFCAFDGFSHHKSEKKKVFEGKKRGQHCVPDEDAIVIVFHPEESSEKRCDQEMKAAAEVSRLAKQFCKEWPDVHIFLEIPSKAQVEKLSVGNGRKSRPLRKNQWVLVMDKVSGKFHQFTDEFGVCEFQNDHFRVLETFAHYVYHETEGKMVVCNLQGVCEKNHFRLASPTVHSASQSYGPRDGGQEAIALFFSNHRCSEACGGWLKPETLEQRLEKKGTQPTPSAPIDISRGRPTFPQGGFDWPSPGESDDIDFSRWSTVGPFGSPLSPPMHGFPSPPPYASPTGCGTSAIHFYWQRMMGSPPPAYDVIPSAPFESDVMAEDKLQRADFPPPYEEACRGLNT